MEYILFFNTIEKEIQSQLQKRKLFCVAYSKKFHNVLILQSLYKNFFTA